MDEHRIMRSSDDFDGTEHLNVLRGLMKESGGTILVAESEKRIVGCVVAVIVEKKESAHAVKSVHVEELVVDESARSNGIGRALVEGIEAWARNEGCGFMRVDCFSNNQRAHAFYEKLGYKDRYVNMIKPLS
jgi:GNAT superfamily N-acetyltransferase